MGNSKRGNAAWAILMFAFMIHDIRTETYWLAAITGAVGILDTVLFIRRVRNG